MLELGVASYMGGEIMRVWRNWGTQTGRTQ